jgi:hypothetical protein
MKRVEYLRRDALWSSVREVLPPVGRSATNPILPDLIPEACYERFLLTLDDRTWTNLLIDMTKVDGGPVRTGIDVIDEMERMMLGGGDGG